MTRRTRRSAALLALAALLVVPAGCGGNEDPAPRPEPDAAATSATDQGRPEVAAYDAWLAALESHDPQAACARHAPEFTIELRQRAILLHRAALGDPCTGFVAVLWEDPAREYDPLAVETTLVTEEDAVLAVDFPGVDETVTMERRHGEWYVVDISPRASGRTDAARWVARWCDLAVGMDRNEVITRMGAPSGEYTVADGGEPQLWWADRQYDFRAYLDPSDRVLDLVGDYDRLVAADRRVLTCPELR